MLTKTIDDLARDAIGGAIVSLRDRIAQLEAQAFSPPQPDYASYRYLAGRHQGLTEALQLIEETLSHHDDRDRNRSDAADAAPRFQAAVDR